VKQILTREEVEALLKNLREGDRDHKITTRSRRKKQKVRRVGACRGYQP